jgi:hypothetical protein
MQFELARGLPLLLRASPHVTHVSRHKEAVEIRLQDAAASTVFVIPWKYVGLQKLQQFYR